MYSSTEEASRLFSESQRRAIATAAQTINIQLAPRIKDILDLSLQQILILEKGHPLRAAVDKLQMVRTTYMEHASWDCLRDFIVRCYLLCGFASAHRVGACEDEEYRQALSDVLGSADRLVKSVHYAVEKGWLHVQDDKIVKPADDD